MKLALIAAAWLAAAPARADRGAVVALGITADARGTGASFSAAGHAEVTPLGGGRLTLSFEDAPLPAPPASDHFAPGLHRSNLNAPIRVAQLKLPVAV